MFPKHGYFFIKSQKSGLFLSVNGEDEAGSKLVAGSKTDDDSQLWSFENGFLISKKSSLVADIDGGDLKSDQKILQFGRKVTMTHNQRWGIRDGFVYIVADPRLVLTIETDEEDSHVLVSNRKLEENDHQQWYLEQYEGDY